MMKILVMNAGSSSQKSSLYELPIDRLPNEPLRPLWEASIDWSKQDGMAALTVETAYGALFEEVVASQSRSQDMTRLLETLWQGKTTVVRDRHEIAVVGHRVVHGGATYRESTWVTDEVKEAIAQLSAFAPVHNPANLAGIKAIDAVLETVPQVAVFDTAFHATLPAAATVYPIPYEWTEKGIRRYGFHGISHCYCAHKAAQILGQDLASLRLMICHLGNGASLSAVRDGQCVDTTMGFTPLEGLMMGTRSGSIDPGISIHLMRQHGISAEELDQLLNKRSGLLGVSGISGDMRQIDAAIAQGNERAQLALEVYIHSLRRHMGAMLPSLGGVDAVVFTAGVGEHSANVRAKACEAFEFLGMAIDPDKNARSPRDTDIATQDSRVRVLVIHTQEDWAIAQECWLLMQQGQAQKQA
ncbi:acetate/propionate family kinase [Leptolyngbya sp. AN02str]|uniref:acetate/propionate family kinase n=1 Tax=Leptolyngbya sp. AN02str TaxID=3423363 RepID=UPI003D319C8B